MADTEFEEFRQIFEHFPNHLKTPAQFYSLVPGLDDGEPSPSPKSDSSGSDCEENSSDLMEVTQHKGPVDSGGFLGQQITLSTSSAEDDEIGDGLRTNQSTSQPPGLARTNSLPFMSGPTERRRRKLPEIPKNKKCREYRANCSPEEEYEDLWDVSALRKFGKYKIVSEIVKKYSGEDSGVL